MVGPHPAAKRPYGPRGEVTDRLLHRDRSRGSALVEGRHRRVRQTRRVADPISWLILVYRIPSEPTRLRASVWRRLRSAGAVYLQNSVAALPDTGGAQRLMRTLRNEIVEDMGGSAQLLRASALVGQDDIVSAFNAARDDEYEEIVDRCRDFMTEIETETAARHFTYAELEENDEDLAKLRRWFEKVSARDVFAAEGANRAREALDGCAKALDGFAARVYEADGS